MPTTHIADINSLTDEEVRERFIAVMVRILPIYISYEYFIDIY